MNDAQAMNFVNNLLGQDKTASAPKAQGLDPKLAAAKNDVLLQLGREKLAEAYEEEQVKLAEAAIGESMAKTAAMLIDYAEQNGVLESIVKTASEGNPDLAQATLELIRDAD